MAYTEVSISGYNATPPTDDGASGATNTITWAKIKEKLGDPLNTAQASVDDNTATACGTIDSAVTSAESTISSLSSSLTTAQSSLYAPSATRMPFIQTSAPTGWTKITTYNDYALRLVSGSVSTGGSTAFTSVFTSRTLTTSEMPSHDHSLSAAGSATLSRTSWTTGLNDNSNNCASGGGSAKQSASLSGSHTVTASITHSGTSGSAGSGSAMDFAVQYVDMILASKD